MNTDNTQTTTITVTIDQLGLIAYAANVTANEMRKIARHYEDGESQSRSAKITANKLDELNKLAINAYQDEMRFANK